MASMTRQLRKHVLSPQHAKAVEHAQKAYTEALSANDGVRILRAGCDLRRLQARGWQDRPLPFQPLRGLYLGY